MGFLFKTLDLSFFYSLLDLQSIWKTYLLTFYEGEFSHIILS